MKTASRIFSTLTIVLTIVIALAAAALVIPKSFGYYPYIVLSGSMEPTIPTGSLTWINTRDTDVGIGDIVTYCLATDAEIGTGGGSALAAESGVFVTHRIIAKYDIADNYWITKGDANENEDLYPVSQDQIVGQYLFNIPKLGYWLNWLGKKGIFLTIAAIVALNIAAILFKYAVFGNDEDEEEKDVEENEPEEKEEKEETEEKQREAGESERKNRRKEKAEKVKEQKAEKGKVKEPEPMPVPDFEDEDLY